MTTEQIELLAKFYGYGFGAGLVISFIGGFMGYYIAHEILPFVADIIVRMVHQCKKI